MEANHAVPRVFHPSVIAAVVTPQIIRPASFVAHYHVSLQISHTPFGRGVVQDAVSYTQDFSQSQANAQHFLDSYAVGTIHVLLQQEQPLRGIIRRKSLSTETNRIKDSTQEVAAAKEMTTRQNVTADSYAVAVSEGPDRTKAAGEDPPPAYEKSEND
ncbi:hypothetical protein WG66_013589 [Moniliophthora roreri]|nr:hypothetical protein WG66_013589 [Moniliophthora roreri]